MPIALTIPKLGLTMTEARVVEWRKAVGEAAERGEVIYIIETEKVVFEVESPEAGTLGRIDVPVEGTVPVGAVVGYLLLSGETPADLPAPAAPATAPGPTPVAATPSTANAPLTSPALEAPEKRISPLARRLAQEHGVDIATITGTGPGGRIVKEDILRAASARQAPAPEALREEAKIVPLSMLRQTIARRMTQSFQQAPHFYLSAEADAAALEAARSRLGPGVEAVTGERLTLTDLLIVICAQALEEQPEVNATWSPEGIRLLTGVHIGVAVAVEGGLIVPVLREANKKSLSQVTAERAGLVRRGRERRLLPDELSGSTFTLSNLGMLGVDWGNAILNPPESALLLVGRVRQEPAVVEGQLAIRPRMALTISADHRVLDGASAARFLVRVKELVEGPPDFAM